MGGERVRRNSRWTSTGSFIPLRIVNKDRDYATEFRPGYERGHTRGLELLRVAAAAREQLGRDSVLPLYTAFGTIIHHDRIASASTTRPACTACWRASPARARRGGLSTDYDDVIGVETQEALNRCGGNIGTPVLRSPSGRSQASSAP